MVIKIVFSVTNTTGKSTVKRGIVLRVTNALALVNEIPFGSNIFWGLS